MRRLPFALALLSCLPGPMQAGAGPLGGVLSEVRGGVLAHDVAFLANDEEEGVDINAEVLFAAPRFFPAEGALDALLNPRPNFGVQANSAGHASQVYAGLTWTFHPLGDVWTGLAAGGTVHDGDLAEGRDGKALGSRVLFRLSAEVGHDLTEALSVSLYFDHESNGGLAEDNEGLNNAGIRVGWRF